MTNFNIIEETRAMIIFALFIVWVCEYFQGLVLSDFVSCLVGGVSLLLFIILLFTAPVEYN
jgi:hypothetical protein